METIYKISKMTCGGCLENVSNALKTVASEVTVTLNPPQALIISDAKIPVETLQKALSEKGPYLIEEITCSN